jgi:hypothetical protein
MTDQEIFDKVITHLRKQGKASENGDGCWYRTTDGKSCAVGCLIQDSDYNESMEGLRLRGLLEKFPNNPSISKMTAHQDLLGRLQHIHDTYSTDRWEDEWEFVAQYKHLTMPAKE